MPLIKGDCFDVVAEMPDACVAMVLTDPPYGATQQKWDSEVDWGRWWKMIDRVLAPKAPSLIFSMPPYDKRLAATNIRRYRYDWIWEKSLAGGFLNANRRPLQAHESVLVFYGPSNRAPLYLPQLSEGHAPVNAFYTATAGECYGDSKIVSGGGQTTRHPRTVLKYPQKPQRKKRHPNEKPVDLLRYLIRTYSEPGDLILDTFAGSGTCVEAAEAEGRNAIGIEITPSEPSSGPQPSP